MTDVLDAVNDDQRAAAYRNAGWWTDTPVLDRYRGTVDAHGTARAVVDDRGVELTHAQLWAASGALLRELDAHGVQPRDVVTIMLPNVVEWQVALLACLRLGAIPAVIPVTSAEDVVRHALALVSAKAVLGTRTRGGRDTADLLCSVAEDLDPGVVVGLLGADGWDWTGPVDRTGRPAPEGVDQVMFTSSTTGLPKAVVHTENTLGAVNSGFANRFGLDRHSPIFMPSPLGHSVGAWHGSRLAMYTGAPLVLLGSWDPEHALALATRYGASFTAAATPFLADLVAATSPGLGELRTFLCGGAPVPPSLLEAAIDRAPATSFSGLWGMTEGGVTTCVPGCPPYERADSVGLPLPGLELRTDADTGELRMRGPGVCTGYLNQDELFRDQLTRDRFFRTGDIANLDEDGHLRITGRIKDVIIRGGVNISPSTTENALAAHPDVTAVAVIGVPDTRLGERIGAVVTTGGAELDLADVCQWLEQQRVPRRQWPERLFTVPDMPRTAAGKIRKNVLRDRVAGGSRA